MAKRNIVRIDEDKCTGCGACKEKCPTVVPDAFNEGLGERQAIYSYFAQGIPSTHTIDPDHCRQLKGKKCGICAKTCQAEAVNFDQEDRIVEAFALLHAFIEWEMTNLYETSQIKNGVILHSLRKNFRERKMYLFRSLNKELFKVFSTRGS